MTNPLGHQRPGARASIYDVATLAGVSHQTVSRVMNNRPNIKDSTRDRVLRAMEEVNYRPNSIARALATNQTKRIGVLVDSKNQYGPNSTLYGVEEAARALGYSVTAASVSDAVDMDLESGLDHLVAQGVDAICAIAPRASALGRLRRPIPGVPTLVITAEHGADPEALTTSVDQYGGATAAVEHLIALGHAKILHLAGPHEWIDARERERAWRDALGAAGLPIIAPVTGDWTSDFGFHYGSTSDDLLQATAVFSANDQMALGLIHGLHSRGIRVPDDISVVGFDDLPDARHFLPPLTTVRQDFHALGTLSLRMLIAAIEGRSPAPESIAAQLIVRESTAAPALARLAK